MRLHIASKPEANQHGFYYAVLYINAYIITREYGGPEEGGWWYDAGEPFLSIRIDYEKDMENALEFVKDFLNARSEDFRVCFEKEPAKYFPEVRPRYE